MTRRDLARLHVGDTSRDLMDSTAILSYKRTNYVIKDKVNDICTRARMSARYIVQVRLTAISMPRKIGNFYTQVLLEDM